MLYVDRTMSCRMTSAIIHHLLFTLVLLLIGGGANGAVAIDIDEVGENVTASSVEIETKTSKFALVLTEVPLNETFIVGGQNAEEGEYPFVAALFSKAAAKHGTRATCTGSLITPYWILTAAHCIGPGAIQVGSHAYIGRTDLNLRPDGVTSVRAVISRVVVHPAYKGYWKGSDLALLRLKYPVNVRPVQIDDSSDLTVEKEKRNIIAVGYGQISNGNAARFLQEIVEPLYSICDCYSIDNSDFFSDSVASRQVCYYPPSTVHRVCFGDSGGPMLIGSSWDSFKIRGVVSYGTGCNQRLPDFYTRVSAFAGWISQTVGGLMSQGSSKTAAFVGVSNQVWVAHPDNTAAHRVCRAKGYATGIRLGFSPDNQPIGIVCLASSVVSFFTTTKKALDAISPNNWRLAAARLATSHKCLNGFLTGESANNGMEQTIACINPGLETFQVAVHHQDLGTTGVIDKRGMLFAQRTGFRVALWNPSIASTTSKSFTLVGSAFTWTYTKIDRPINSFVVQDCDPKCPISCPAKLRGDGICNAACNNANCQFDHGDCKMNNPKG